MKELWDKYKIEIGLGLLFFYVISLGAATADEIFKIGLFPTKLDQKIESSLDNYYLKDANLEKTAMRDLVEYGDFAVPKLVGALNDGDEVQALCIKTLQKITGNNFKTAEEWKKWYSDHRGDY